MVENQETAEVDLRASDRQGLLSTEGLLLQLVLAAVVGGAANTLLTWAWMSLVPHGLQWFSPKVLEGMLILRGSLAGAAVWIAHTAAISRSTIGRALWAGLPAALVPLTEVLSVAVWKYIHETGNPDWFPPGSIHHILVFGSVVWAIVLLDYFLPRWGGVILGGAVLLALALWQGHDIGRSAISRGWDSGIALAMAGRVVINSFAPVWPPFVVLKLTRRLVGR